MSWLLALPAKFKVWSWALLGLILTVLGAFLKGAATGRRSEKAKQATRTAKARQKIADLGEKGRKKGEEIHAEARQKIQERKYDFD